ncbi:hypothetical protein KUTeg_006371 [Tegillarca granosa]|uniref:Dynein heavy chain n=1 Tax=Tegillarca granosa TaxID=220873 RepID=A0ABQ9FG96_TEGGR|nr:hypothetical protein KUTeg_006371 [Tegillarca granosa]
MLANVGILSMTMADVGWKLMLVQWLEKRTDADKELLTGFCDVYIEKTIDYLTQCTTPHMFTGKKAGIPQYKRVVPHTVENMVSTFCTLVEALVASYPDLSDVEFERYFNFAAIWAFGGTLDVEHRESFSNWWKEEFSQHIDYPEEGLIFDYVVDNESHEFTRWTDMIPSYSGDSNTGISAEAFVHTVPVEQLSYLLGVLSDYGKPVLFVGENGCGKTAIINDRIRTVCSGEVAEVLSLTVQANRFTNARLLYDRLDERLEWKHGRTYVPRGNKRLLCLVDDINLSQVDKHGHQTAIELVRQHIDDGGFYSEDTHAWRYIKNVTYVSTINPNSTANVPRLSQRFLRHFAVFGCPYPGTDDLQTIFSTLLQSHFIAPEMSSGVAAGQHHMHDEKAQALAKEEEESLRKVLCLIVKVNVELQDRLRSMFLPTAQRCHYLFTMRDLGTIFKNLSLSLRPACSRKNLLLLWQHECFWVYGHRMVNDVDYRRFKQAFVTAVKKEFTSDEQIHLMIKTRQPLFSNLIEQDSGIVTAGMIDMRHSSSVSEEDAKTDIYRPVFNMKGVKDLMSKGVEEYNKIHPRIKLALYTSVVEQVCRITRTIASPHEIAHSVLIAEGCPGRCTVIVKLAAHLCGYTVYQINPSSLGATAEYKMEQFKTDLVQGYTRAGSKGEKILLLLHEEELLEEDFLVFLIEFIVSGSISHLFSYEDQTTIINSIRTEVTQAGLTYTRDTAWNFFLKTVRNNFRICLIAGDGGRNFQRRCREYPAFTKNVNFIWFPHWSKAQLVDHAQYHLQGVTWMTDIQRENIAHMLASMHLVLRQQDGQEKDAGEYRHITNTSYEKFVERYISLASARHKDVEEVQLSVTKSLNQIRKENEVATKLRKQLEHELIVLEERKMSTIRILTQIGQDTAITEQQIKVVKAQLDRISKLKKLLPEYQVAHERAVYKAIAIVGDTKRVVQNMSIDKLAELRAMSKPIIDIEDLMTAIIMILKSPSADLTWQKGAKRQMANLERFIEELMSFDDNQLPEATLNLVEPYLKKPSFDPETLEKKTGNSACGALCKWVRGVVKYHRMMISKVKPLHQKVDATTQAVDEAEHRMATLESKRKEHEGRLLDLARRFEDATIDKNEQDDKTIKMKKMLETAAQLRKILKGERQRCQQIYDSYERRLVSIPGGCSMAAAFCTYLGPYHHNFRRVMLTVYWPNCLRERGVPLVIDSIDGLKGRVIDWSIDFLKTASGASTVYDIDYTSALLNIQEGEELEQGEQTARSQYEDEKNDGKANEKALDRIQEEGSEADKDDKESQVTTSSAPMLTSMQYNRYVVSLIKILVGERTLNDWLKKDFGPRQIENAAILCSSWQRPPMMIDPNGEGATWLAKLNRLTNKRKLVSLDMETRSDPHVILTLEKCIMNGKPVLLRNCEEHIDNIITPLMHHRNTSIEFDTAEEIASSTTLINFGVSHDTLTEDLLSRAFARIRPELYKERNIALRNMQLQKDTLLRLSDIVKEKVLTNQEAMLGSAKALKFITDITNAKIESVHNEYQFSLRYFVELFDEAIGGEIPVDFWEEEEGGYDVDDESTEADPKARAGSVTSHGSKESATGAATGGTTDKQTSKKDKAESASTSAANKLIAGEESEELPPLELPETATLPSEGVQYSSLSANQIKQVMDKLTGLVYRRIRQSLYEEDCLLFATLLCLNIEAEGMESFTNEEMSLLLQGNPGLGMQLTLADFDCKDDPPNFLPQEKWEDILALSVLPGPLDSLCVNFAQNADAWKEWYKSEHPENEPLPLSPSFGGNPSTENRPGSAGSRKSAGGDKSPDLGPLSDFHQLLLLRMLRPDRLPVALVRYVNKHLTLNLPEQSDFSLTEVIQDAKRHLGVLLLLPPSASNGNKYPAAKLRLTQPPVEILRSMAKSIGVAIEHVRVGEGCEYLVDEAIDSAEKSDGWVIIEGLHLAPLGFYNDLKKHLVRCARSRGETESDTKGDDEGKDPPFAISFRSPNTFLHTAIVSTLKQCPQQALAKTSSEAQTIRMLTFGIGVIQGVLASRQLFGAQGLNQWYPFNKVQMEQAIDLLTGRIIRSGESEDPNLEILTGMISKLIYENSVLTESDKVYVDAIVHHVVKNLSQDTSGNLTLGGVSIPTPPANVDPVDFGNWYEKNVDEEFTLPALQLHSSVEKESNDAVSGVFIKNLDYMFETQNMEAGDLSRAPSEVINISRLRSALDICMEELPNLLELGHIPDIVKDDYDFPYHRPSNLSLSSVSSSSMPESIGYVLLQECLWFNRILCHIRQDISVLQQSILSGPEAIFKSYLTTVYALQEEHVPISWIHPNCQPCTHSLVSWLDGNSSLYRIPYIYLRPKTTLEKDDKNKENQKIDLYPCPVYMNKSRQVQSCILNLNCPSPVDKWKLARTALVLDAGLPEDGIKKSRSYLLLMRAPHVIPAEDESDIQSEEEEELRELEAGEEVTDTDANQSEQSQLSYRPMSPKAPPLPPGLGLMREDLMTGDDETRSDKKSSKDSVAKSQGKGSKESIAKSQDGDKVQRTSSREGKTTPKNQGSQRSINATPTQILSPKPGATPPPGVKTPVKERQSRPGTRASATSKRSKLSVHSKADVEEENENENRPRSMHEDPITQMEIQDDGKKDDDKDSGAGTDRKPTTPEVPVAKNEEKAKSVRPKTPAEGPDQNNGHPSRPQSNTSKKSLVQGSQDQQPQRTQSRQSRQSRQSQRRWLAANPKSKCAAV